MRRPNRRTAEQTKHKPIKRTGHTGVRQPVTSSILPTTGTGWGHIKGIQMLDLGRGAFRSSPHLPLWLYGSIITYLPGIKWSSNASSRALHFPLLVVYTTLHSQGKKQSVFHTANWAVLKYRPVPPEHDYTIRVFTLEIYCTVLVYDPNNKPHEPKLSIKLIHIARKTRGGDSVR